MKTNALWITGKEKVEIKPVEIQDPTYGEIQVECKICGICAMDNNMFKGNVLPGGYPFRFGHEAVGVVKKIGPYSKKYKPGDKVFCAGLSGMMAEIINVPESKSARIPDGVEDYSQWIGEPVTCVVNGLEQMQILPGEIIAVIGTGYMGLLNIQGLDRTLVGGIIAFDIDNSRLNLAKEFNADEIYNIEESEGKKAIDKIKLSGGIDTVIECSGTKEGFKLAEELVKASGKISLFAWHHGQREFDGTKWHMGGIQIHNTSPMSAKHSGSFEASAALMRRGVFNQKKLITHISHYKEAQDIMEISSNKKDNYIKGAISF